MRESDIDRPMENPPKRPDDFGLTWTLATANESVEFKVIGLDRIRVTAMKLNERNWWRKVYNRVDARKLAKEYLAKGYKEW